MQLPKEVSDAFSVGKRWATAVKMSFCDYLCDYLYFDFFFGLTFGDAATSMKDARALCLCPMKEYFKIMLKQKNKFHLHLITAKAHVLSLKVRRAERQSKKIKL